MPFGLKGLEIRPRGTRALCNQVVITAQCPYHQSFELQQLVSKDNREIRNIQSVKAAKLDLRLIGKPDQIGFRRVNRKLLL